jgi:hypothetical protein
VVIEVVGGPNPKIEWRWGVWPAKPKTECAALSISLVIKSFQGGVVGICRVGWRW